MGEHLHLHPAVKLPMRRTALSGLMMLVAVALFMCGMALPVQAGSVVAKVDLSRQRMVVKVNGVTRYSWPVSTARRGYVTPTGTYRPQRMYQEYYSRKYNNSPMPHAIFFRGGYAIHGSYATHRLGSRASHGCIRLSPRNAARLYSLVRTHGPGNTIIRITH
ncbi:MAG: L,D-transpeptidase [Xanthobacter sp.]